MSNAKDDVLTARLSRRGFLASAAALSVLPATTVAWAGRVSEMARGDERTHASAQLRVDVNPGHVMNSFDPDESLGSSMNELSPSIIDRIYTPEIIHESLSAG